VSSAEPDLMSQIVTAVRVPPVSQELR
jgi:hypothetical protein